MFLSENDFIIYLSKERINNINFDKHEEIEKYFRKLFLLLKKIYNISINGYYDITLYNDKIYGIILKLEKDDFDFDIFDNQVEMNIRVIDAHFLYEIDDYFFLDNLNDIDIYIYNHKFYLFLKNKINDKNYLNVLEFSKVIYGDVVNKILNNGLKLKNL